MGNVGKKASKPLDAPKGLVGFWPHVGSLLEAFWEPKGLQKSSEFLDAILEAKKGGVSPGSGSAWRNARGPGEDYAAPPLAGAACDESHT